VLKEMRALKHQSQGGSIAELERIVGGLGEALPQVVVEIQEAIS
jgi:tetratricopeptide (TPR) repeat protein